MGAFRQKVFFVKKKITLLLSHVFVAALATVITLSLSWRQPIPDSYTKLEQLEDLIQERFIGEADPTAMEDAAAHAMIAALGDRWSYYIPASEYAIHVEQMNNAYVGIGITITPLADGTGLEIMMVNEGGPAEEAGLQVGDIILAVDGQPCKGMTTTEVRDLVRGKPGTKVALGISRNGETLFPLVERREVKVPVATAQLLENNVGLVTIANFDSRCAEETIASIESLLDQGAEKLLFDVRNNPGGYADELIKVLDYLLPEGKLFHMEYYTGEEEVTNSDRKCLDIPMAVLVNADSYSAAEFFAVALQEYEAAVVLGEKTSGKGYFQTTINLRDGSAVGLSIGKYYTPKGISLEGVGITPDVEVTVDEETYLAIYYGWLEPEEDPQIQAALELLK